MVPQSPSGDRRRWGQLDGGGGEGEKGKRVWGVEGRGERPWARAGKEIVGGKRKEGGRNEGSGDVEEGKESEDVEEEMEG